MHFHPPFRSLLSAAAGAALLLCGAAAQAQESFKIGVVTFLSGQAAESFGIPAVNGAKVLVDAFNRGAAPAPYDKKGIGGLKIEAVYVDEAGGATKQVQELRTLYDREKVDAVVGYVGSGDCLAVAPVAEELKRFLILHDCGTPRIFEDNKFSYVFRTASHATMDNVALARYLKARNVKAGSINLINQDYAWGHDAKADFTAAMGQFYPAATVGQDLLPKFGAGQYGTEISALLSKPADVTHTSLWGGDLQALMLQAGPRGLFKRTQLVISAGDHVLPVLGQRMPDGVILGARGAYGQMAPKSALNDWWNEVYAKANNGQQPLHSPYRMAQALLGLKLAAEKAMAANGGKKPSPEQLAAALRGSEWDSPGGRIRMALADGHQAIQDTAIARTRYDAASKKVVLEDIAHFPAECVNPPAGTTAEAWIKAGFPGAKNCP
ncbi:ABC transporter substrate-binding protein [Acidovorax sp.]|uniref:ABC transporter substrate-binding protein n=1 Tax=Acidovorax sp. TaxID=1872122 RepID=UPI00262A8CFA|nr:ABC transporter substrate-binding protein [Acidovorax sp.]